MFAKKLLIKSNMVIELVVGEDVTVFGKIYVVGEVLGYGQEIDYIK